MKKYYDTKIGKIIEEEFDTRWEAAVFSYIMDDGIENIKEITDDDIALVHGNGLVTERFSQALVRCARRICVECEWIEIIEYIRLYLSCNPCVKEVKLYKENFSEASFSELIHELDVDADDVNDVVSLYAVVDEDCLKGDE